MCKKESKIIYWLKFIFCVALYHRYNISHVSRRQQKTFKTIGLLSEKINLAENRLRFSRPTATPIVLSRSLISTNRLINYSEFYIFRALRTCLFLLYGAGLSGRVLAFLVLQFELCYISFCSYYNFEILLTKIILYFIVIV